MTAKKPQITSNDVDMHDTQELDISSNRSDEDIHLEKGSAGMMLDDRTKALLAEEKAMRAFMEEPLTFTIAETDDPNAPNPVSAGVNGVIKHFTRGEVYTVPRKFVDSLIKVSFRLKTINFIDKEGLYQTKLERVPSMVYPIQIMNDPSGMGPNDRGRRWFVHQQKNAI